ncbi:MAG TPA: O-antigen ligase family protein [Thermoanaerobaculia bacterium]|nr:O-antigen ligase family protein [Thermoanaerobaculia bacterium]
MIRQIDLLATGLAVLFLIWAPLPFGGVTPWAETSLEVLAFLCLALAFLALGRFADLRPVLLPIGAILGVALFGLIQALPWPAPLVAFLSPAHSELYRQAAALLAPAPAGLPRLTVAVPATRSAALLWIAAGACLVVGAVVGHHRRGRRVLGAAVLLSALFQILFGARSAMAGERTLWGVLVPISAARLRGTFFNPNHLAVYLEMALPIAFAWAFWSIRRARYDTSIERRLLMVAPSVLFWLLLFSGLGFTASRGGLLAATAAAGLQGALLAILYRRWDLAPLGAVAAVVGLAVAAAAGIEEGLSRLLHSLPADVSWGARRQAWAATVELWQRFPVTGAGLGAFRDAFPLVQPASLPGTWWHAHSGPLEVLATTGLAGVLLFASGLAFLALRLLAVLSRGRRSEDRAAGLAAMGILASLAIHESFDFGLTLPANALTLAVLVGAAASARLGSNSPIAIPAAPWRQGDRAGEDRAAGDALDLEEVQARRERAHKAKRSPRRRRKST